MMWWQWDQLDHMQIICTSLQTDNHASTSSECSKNSLSVEQSNVNRADQLGYWTTRGHANSRTANWRTGYLADQTTRVLDKSRTRQLTDATGDFACLVFVLLAASARPRVVQSATCPVRELAVRELAYPRVVQLPPGFTSYTYAKQVVFSPLFVCLSVLLPVC